MPTVYDPLRSGGLELANRFAVPAMVTRLSGDDGYVNDAIIDRYRNFAAGGAGLVVVEAASIHGGKSGPLLKVSDDSFVPGLSRLADACHRAGPAKVFLQIIHFLKIARSGWRQRVGDLSIDELEALPDLFADAAERAQAAGFDGVELHMAHAYTLSSMLSRLNRRRDHYGRTIENRLRLPSMVLARVRERVGEFAVAVRFDADESIRHGYSIDDAARFGVRFAELGAAYISLSAGGKFEDAQHREGEPLYPYTGYSGDRCMPGNTAPDAVNIWMAEAVRGAVRDAGHQTPVLGTGKIPNATVASEVIERGACDIVGMARALLADPYLPTKSRSGRADQVVSCIYCNVCKSLDESFKTVVCYLWPAGTTQAPQPGDDADAPITWPDPNPLTGRTAPGEIRLRWVKPSLDHVGFDVMRSTDGDAFERLTSCTRISHLDATAVRGHSYGYRVIPYDTAGRRGTPSNTVELSLDEEAW